MQGDPGYAAKGSRGGSMDGCTPLPYEQEPFTPGATRLIPVLCLETWMRRIQDIRRGGSKGGAVAQMLSCVFVFPLASTK